IWLARTPGWIAVALGVLDSILYGQPFLHALLAPVFFAAVVAACVVTSKSWQMPAATVEASWEPLKNLATLVPVLVVLQAGLGAAYRHNDLCVMWHIGNAMIVLLAVLVVGVFVMRQYPEHRTLRHAALALL